MTYRLKKDLPFAKAGTHAYSRMLHDYDGYRCYRININSNNSKECYVVETPIDEFNEWFEEVKPREFRISLDAYGKPRSILSENEKNVNYFNVIKVREVIE